VRRRIFCGTGAVAALAGLAGCGGEAPPPPTVVGIAMRATSDVNPDGTGAAKPLRVRVLRLTNTQALAQAEFFALDANPMRVLGQELVGFDDFVLAPGGTLAYEQEFEPTARHVGVMGAYYAIDRAQWRAWAPVARNVTNLFAASFGPAGVQLAEAGA
jgi:type VI secretion system VasD/TssJ family lipoprotein